MSRRLRVERNRKSIRTTRLVQRRWKAGKTIPPPVSRLRLHTFSAHSQGKKHQGVFRRKHHPLAPQSATSSSSRQIHVDKLYGPGPGLVTQFSTRNSTRVNLFSVELGIPHKTTKINSIHDKMALRFAFCGSWFGCREVGDKGGDSASFSVGGASWCSL